MKKLNIIDTDGYLKLTVRLPVVDSLEKIISKIPGQFMPFYVKKFFTACIDKFVKESI